MSGKSRGSADRQLVLVTGGSSGIGLATALKLAADGHSLVLLSRSEPALREAAEQCLAAGAAQVSWVVCDVSDADAVQRAFTQARSLGQVSTVVQAAGVIAYGAFTEVPTEHAERVLDVTLLGAANVIRSSLLEFRRNGERGRLVVVGSMLGRVVTPYMSSYITAKWALHGLVRTVQVEQRRHRGVQVSLVAPGPVDTPIYEHAASRLRLGRRPPVPVDSPEQVADHVLACLRRPRRLRTVGRLTPLVTLGFTLLPRMYDAIVTTVFRSVAMTSTQADDTDGNIFHPVLGEAVHGGWVRPHRRRDRFDPRRTPAEHGRPRAPVEDPCARW